MSLVHKLNGLNGADGKIDMATKDMFIREI